MSISHVHVCGSPATQIAVPTRTDVPEYQKLRATAHRIVGRINGRFGSVGYHAYKKLLYSTYHIPYAHTAAISSRWATCNVPCTRILVRWATYNVPCIRLPARWATYNVPCTRISARWATCSVPCTRIPGRWPTCSVPCIRVPGRWATCRSTTSTRVCPSKSSARSTSSPPRASSLRCATARGMGVRSRGGGRGCGQWRLQLWAVEAAAVGSGGCNCGQWRLQP